MAPISQKIGLDLFPISIIMVFSSFAILVGSPLCLVVSFLEQV